MTKTGDIMVEEGLVSPGDVDQVLAIQEKNRTSLTRNRGQLFGMVLCDLNLVTPLDTYCVLDKHEKLISVSDFLVQKNIVTQSRIDRARARARAKDIPFISYLLEDQIVPKTLLQQVLFDLFHIPFRSVSDVVFNQTSRDKLSGIIDKEQAGEHKVIPLQLTGNTLLAGITDPDNLVFLRELDQQFPQYRFSPVFIPFSGFTWFYKLLYRENWGAKKANNMPVDLSLLMKFSVSVTDPDRDKKKILSLYDRYEQVRMQSRNQEEKRSAAPVRNPDDRSGLFFTFIRQNYTRISREYNCSGVEFSLKKTDDRLMVTALPQKERSWQK
ncbi:MAG: hypothetical protein MI863_21075 [Desulfobacterales bacterium]|nr:hypothetical protein [Desulfobacterales bacterium]